VQATKQRRLNKQKVWEINVQQSADDKDIIHIHGMGVVIAISDNETPH
jgi:hypothetical protein